MSDISGPAAASGTPDVAVPVPGPEPRPTLLKRPWTSDTIFWVGIILLGLFGVAGVRSAVRTVSTPFGVGGLWFVENLTLAMTTAIWFALVLVVPAAIRNRIRKSKRRKALAAGPGTSEPGWQVDPVDPTRYRWWNGTGWDDVVAPAPVQRPAGAWGVALLVIVLAGPMAVFTLWGLAQTSSGSAASPAPSVPDDNPNVDLAVEAALTSLLQSTEDFLKTPVDPDDLEGSMRETAAKLPAVESDYEYFSAVVGAISDQSQLGPGMPSLGALNTLNTDMGEWLQIRRDFVEDIKRCEIHSNQLAYADCAVPIFERFETPLQDTTLKTGASFQAVVDSLNQQ